MMLEWIGIRGLSNNFDICMYRKRGIRNEETRAVMISKIMIERKLEEMEDLHCCC